MSYKQTESKSQCPRCAENGRDSKGDNLHNYGEGKGSFCFSCNYTILSDDEKERRGIGKFEWDDEMEAEVASKELLTKEELEQIQGYTLALERAGVDNWEGMFDAVIHWGS